MEIMLCLRDGDNVILSGEKNMVEKKKEGKKLQIYIYWGVV